MMKRYLTCGVSKIWMGLEFGQGCQANLKSLNRNADSFQVGGSFQSSFISLLSESMALSYFFLVLVTLTQRR